MNASDGRARLPLELVVVWLLFVVDAAAMLVTYSRVPARGLYHVSHSGLAGGASRVLVFSNFSTALAAIAILALLADRLLGRVWQGVAAAGVVLCAAVFWPGVVDQADLDAKPADAVASAGVLLALALSAVAVRPPPLVARLRRALRRLDGLLRGREHRQRLLDRAGEQARLDELAVPGRPAAEADNRLGRDPARHGGALRRLGLVVRASKFAR